MLLNDIMKNIDYKLIGEYDGDIDSLACDTNKVKNGSLFYCLKGLNHDGHNFANQAVENGAKIIMCEYPLDVDVPQIIVSDVRKTMAISAGNFYGNPRDKIKLIGVTGTNGKTTTTYMIQSILKDAGQSVGVIGTIGILFDDIKFPNNMTTPDPIEMHRIFADMVRMGIDTVVMEVSAHAIALEKMSGIICDIGILTNVTQDHLDYFKTFDKYAEIKKRFISKEFCNVGIVNVDDKVGREIYLDKFKDIPIYSFGLRNPADVFSPRYKFNTNGTKYLLNLFDNLINIDTKLIGEFNLYNALASSTACYLDHISFDHIQKGLSIMKDVPGRFNVINLPNSATVIIDYAHTPDGLKNILTSVRLIADKNVISVFGCGGNRDTTKRAIMGEISGELADYSIITSDNPRFENPEDIILQIEDGISKITSNYLCITDRRQAISYALQIADMSDIVVISGKGAEDYIEIGGEKVQYNDKDVVYEEYNNLLNNGVRKC